MSKRRNRPLSAHTVAVLRSLETGTGYGFDVMDVTGLPSGTVYPILSRMASRGFVEAAWEDPALSQAEGRPARKYYRLTPEGRVALREAMERLRALGAPLPHTEHPR